MNATAQPMIAAAISSTSTMLPLRRAGSCSTGFCAVIDWRSWSVSAVIGRFVACWQLRQRGFARLLSASIGWLYASAASAYSLPIRRFATRSQALARHFPESLHTPGQAALQAHDVANHFGHRMVV